MGQVTKLQQRYRDEIAPQLKNEMGWKSLMRVPRIEKVVINMGMGEAIVNPKSLDAAVADMVIIAGQRPVITKAKKSIATFKLREGMPIGVMTTLRGKRMYDFLDRLLNTAMPRIRDFQGVSASSFDNHGNYSLGIKEQLIFPEIDYDKIDKIRGLQVSIVTTARNDEEGKRLLELIGMPFAR